MTTTNIVIVNWKCVSSTMTCLQAIDKSNDREFRVIIVDNYSTDEEHLEIRRLVAEASKRFETYLVATEGNLGYAGGNNAGIAFLARNKLPGDVLILNPDVRISPSTLARMKAALTPGVGVVNVRTTSADGKVLYDGLRLRGFLQRPIISSDDTVPTDVAQGACMLLGREVLQAVGVFDERFFLYWEEVDLSLRIKALGHQLVAITTSSVVRGNNSKERLPSALYYSVRNARLIRDKHPSVFSRWAYPLHLLHSAIITMKLASHPRLFRSAIAAIWAGYWDSRHGIYHRREQPFLPSTTNGHGA